MNIQLKPEDEQLIQIQIAKGKYGNAEEVVSFAYIFTTEAQRTQRESFLDTAPD